MNLVINPDLNGNNYPNINNKQARSIVLEVIAYLGMVDIWRERHEKKESIHMVTNKY